MRKEKINLYNLIRRHFWIQGPVGLPLVGHIPFIDVKNVGRSCKKLGKKYGDIFSIFLGTKTVVVLNSWPLIKEAFSMKEFSGRPGMFSGTFFQKGKTGESKKRCIFLCPLLNFWSLPIRSFHFLFLVTFGDADEGIKTQKYYLIFVYILQGKMGKSEKNKSHV